MPGVWRTSIGSRQTRWGEVELRAWTAAASCRFPGASLLDWSRSRLRTPKRQQAAPSKPPSNEGVHVRECGRGEAGGIVAAFED